MNNKNVTYVLVALIIGISFTISSYFLSNGLINLRAERKVITVTGSAKKQLRSDLVKWTGMYTVVAKDLKEAYRLLEESQKKVKTYFLSKGLSEKDLIFSSISTQTIYEMLPNGIYSTKVDSYKLSQSIKLHQKM